MNSEEKIKFVEAITSNVTEEIINNIIIGKVPEDWEGIELRWYLADKFQDCVYDIYKKPSKRKREYKNTILVENL
jgi:hypothetical protein